MIDTNWHVITGGPCSGKTTLIEQLKKQGFTIAPEVAREYISQLLASNYTLDDLLQHNPMLQRGILAASLKRERNLQPEDLIFFDRGTTDSLGYFDYYTLDCNKNTLHHCQKKRYKKIFFCQQLPIAADTIRIEDAVTARQIGESIHQAYTSLGYELIILPVIPVEQRIALIRSHL